MALFSEEDGQDIQDGPRRVELNRHARNEIVEEISLQKPAYMRKSGNLGGECIHVKEKPVKSSGRKMIGKNRFAGSSLPSLKSNKTTSRPVDTTGNYRRPLARRANEDELCMLFKCGMKK